MKIYMFFLRVSLGILFFYAGITKVIDLSWSAAGYIKFSPAVQPIANHKLYKWMGTYSFGNVIIIGHICSFKFLSRSTLNAFVLFTNSPVSIRRATFLSGRRAYYLYFLASSYWFVKSRQILGSWELVFRFTNMF